MHAATLNLISTNDIRSQPTQECGTVTRGALRRRYAIDRRFFHSRAFCVPIAITFAVAIACAAALPESDVNERKVPVARDRNDDQLLRDVAPGPSVPDSIAGVTFRLSAQASKKTTCQRCPPLARPSPPVEVTRHTRLIAGLPLLRWLLALHLSPARHCLEMVSARTVTDDAGRLRDSRALRVYRLSMLGRWPCRHQ
jgi:hypothetical protein